MKLGEFFKDQGIKKTADGKLVKKDQEASFPTKNRTEELREFGYELDEDGNLVVDENGNPVIDKSKKDFDPINQKDYSYAGQYRPFEKKHEEKYTGAELDEFLDEASLYDFAYKVEAGDKEGEVDFEDVDIMGEISKMQKIQNEQDKKDFRKALKEQPNYSAEEQLFMQDKFKEWLKKSFLNKSFKTPEKEQELINEFKSEFPENFAVLTRKKVLSEEIEWEKEVFRDKEGKRRAALVNYYPDKNNPKIKYIYKGGFTGGIIPNELKTDRVFVGGIAKGKKTILLFCEELKSPKRKKPIIKKSPRKTEGVAS